MANVTGMPQAGVFLPQQEPSFAQAKAETNPTTVPFFGGLPPVGCTAGAPCLPSLLILLIWLYFATSPPLSSAFCTQHVLFWLGTHPQGGMCDPRGRAGS